MKYLGLALSAAMVVAASGGAMAQYPERPITLIVPFSAGSPVDGASRFMADILEKEFGQSIIVENKPGAGGTTGTTDLAKAAADGYTLGFLTSSAVVVAPALYKSLDYDPLKDLDPVIANYATGVVLEVNEAVPANTVQEFIAYAKANPGLLSFASNGIGTVPHMAAEIFMQATGVEMVHIPYRGSPQASADVVAGNVHVYFDPASSAAINLQSGKVKILVSVAPQRAPELPDVPTAAEAGVPEIGQPSPWFGFFGPAGLPPEVIERISSVLNEKLQTDEAKAQLAKFGMLPGSITGDDLEKLVAADLARHQELVRVANIPLQ